MLPLSMRGADYMFGEESFTDEVQSAGQAEQCVEYLASNEHKYRSELIDEGLTYDEVQAKLKRLWSNLAAACAKVNHSDMILRSKQRQFDL